VAAGVRLHEDSRASRIDAAEAGHSRVMTAAGAEVLASHVLVCGDAYLDGVCPPVERRVMPIGSFVVATEPLDPGLAIMTGAAGAMDTRFVVNYWQKTAGGRLVFGGGEKYTPAWPADIAGFVRTNLAKVYPALAKVAFSHAWAGAVGITPTRLPFVRQIAPGVLVSAGCSGQGVALAPYFGRLLAASVLARGAGHDVLARLPVPEFPGGRLLRWPLLTAALSWYALRDWLA
jgi:gamma-glutamylputrescine oxidase